MKVSIVIPTIKNPLVLKSVKNCPVKHEVILSKKHGLGYARNWGAKQASNDLLIFFDDDIILDKNIWSLLLSIKPKSFAMLKIKDKCCSRVVVIHKKDYWNMGGFDDNIKYSAEDVDFYLQALQAGLKYIPIPTKLVVHVEHRERWRNPIMNIKMKFQHAYLIVKHGKSYIDFWDGFLAYFLLWMRRPRTYMPTFIGIFYYLFLRLIKT